MKEKELQRREVEEELRGEQREAQACERPTGEGRCIHFMLPQSLYVYQ